MSLAPIILFVYNRHWHTRQTVESLQKNILAKQSELFVFSDGSKDERDKRKVSEVRKYIHTISGFKKITIRERRKNLGLANSVIAGVTEIISKYGKVIVLEDDLFISPYFLQFMNEGLNYYKNEKKVASIHGYVFPVKEKLPETFFLKHSGSLGWATWKNRWDLFECNGRTLLKELEESNSTWVFNHNNSYKYTRLLESQIRGKVDSWAIRWYASVFLKNMLTLYPGKSLVLHMGNDGSGTHYGFSHDLDTEISNHPICIRRIKVEENETAFNEYFKYYKSIYLPFPFWLIKKIIRRARG